LLAVLLHNLIDFAIFEPGNYTAFWALVACAVGPYMNRSKGKDRSFPQSTQVRMGCALGIGMGTVAVLLLVVVMPVRSCALLQNAIRNKMSSESLLEEAAATDPIDPLPVAYLGKFYMAAAETTDAPVQYLQSAIAAFEQAARRSGADFKHYRSLTECAIRLSEREKNKRTFWLEQAFQYAGKAIERYPGSGELHFQRARIADQLNRTDAACYHYAQAVEIEDAYRKQFTVMYPGRALFSRLGDEKYQFAGTRLLELQR
jgi:tetratricopeptide (TPR) repeat protein